MLWSLLRACPNPQAALYITNFGCHFLPVTSVINSCIPTFEGSLDHVTFSLQISCEETFPPFEALKGKVHRTLWRTLQAIQATQSLSW